MPNWKIDPPKHPKKITGTRFASILGLNPWATPFETWCEITRTYEKPFEDTIYTIAGKTIEPKQAEYMRKNYFMENLQSPTDVYGADYFKKTFGDFFPNDTHFGGMWDYRLVDENGKPTAILEMKTTKRAEDWEDDIPEYYAMQAALYAWLSGTDQVIMVASFLEESDHAKPEAFVPSAENTVVIPFKVSERYPDFEAYIYNAETWWKEHVLTGESPDYDEKKDAEVLKELRKSYLDPDEDMKEVVSEAEDLYDKIAAKEDEMLEDRNRLKLLIARIKAESEEHFGETDREIITHGARYDFVVSRSERVSVDEDKMKEDGILDKYKTKNSVTYRLTARRI